MELLMKKSWLEKLLARAIKVRGQDRTFVRKNPDSKFGKEQLAQSEKMVVKYQLMVDADKRLKNTIYELSGEK